MESVCSLRMALAHALLAGPKKKLRARQFPHAISKNKHCRQLKQKASADSVEAIGTMEMTSIQQASQRSELNMHPELAWKIREYVSGA
jgi:hypothetical protein